jgi:hypothetical protein
MRHKDLAEEHHLILTTKTIAGGNLQQIKRHLYLKNNLKITSP